MEEPQQRINIDTGNEGQVLQVYKKEEGKDSIYDGLIPRHFLEINWSEALNPEHMKSVKWGQSNVLKLDRAVNIQMAKCKTIFNPDLGKKPEDKPSITLLMTGTPVIDAIVESMETGPFFEGLANVIRHHYQEMWPNKPTITNMNNDTARIMMSRNTGKLKRTEKTNEPVLSLKCYCIKGQLKTKIMKIREDGERVEVPLSEVRSGSTVIPTCRIPYLAYKESLSATLELLELLIIAPPETNKQETSFNVRDLEKMSFTDMDADERVQKLIGEKRGAETAPAAQKKPTNKKKKDEF